MTNNQGNRFVLPACVAMLIFGQAATSSMQVRVPGRVTAVPVGDLLQRRANFFDLEGKSVRLQPAGRGRYRVRVGPLAWVETGGRRVLEFSAPPQPLTSLDLFEDSFEDPHARAWRRRAFAGDSSVIHLPFRFPFAGRRWSSVHANKNGNLSFRAPEEAHWDQRDPWADGTMRAVAAAVDSRSAAAMEAMIAALWAVYDTVAISVDSTPRRVAITWDAIRFKPDGYAHYAPRGRNVFQVRLYPSGRIDIAFRQVRERDGFVGVFHGAGRRGRTISVTDDTLGDAPRSVVDIVSAEFVDNGSTLIASLTMAEDIPRRVPSGRLDYRFFMGRCAVTLTVSAEGRRSDDRCSPAPSGFGYTVEGATLEILIPKVIGPSVDRDASWFWDAVWWGPDHWDRLDGREPVDLSWTEQDLSSMRRAVTGNVFEVFHYPSISKDIGEVMTSIYRRDAPGRNRDALALPFTDFRIDDLFVNGPATGPINVPVRGIGPGQERPRDASEFGGSTRLLSSASPLFIGAPRFVERGTDNFWGTPRGFRRHAYVIWWIAHELIHRWSSYLSFRDPETGRIEPLFADSCACHWSQWLHAPARHPVWRAFSDRPYREASVMGGGVWRDNSDGTFTWQNRNHPLATGLSDLDLYVMGVIPASQVRPTFLLRDVEETGTWGTVRARKVPVRIENIVAAMGPRAPSTTERQGRLPLGVYLLHKEKRPRPVHLRRARSVARAVETYFSEATGGR